ncbi:hypothetical protein F4778DRAFT_193863 [Xylariomycetidae sp. FL2044]|nr:hypothetical protein F4778DRAFT_193863 [Xylariomycetidae sp. FL2044]
MGRITKPLLPKQKETFSSWLQTYVEEATNAPLPLLPKILENFPSRWPFPRGDLYHWIPLLNRFDDILESFCTTYKLNQGPQARDIGCEVLLKHDWTVDANKGSKENQLVDLGYGDDGDKILVVAILKFTQMLLDHCGNRSIYASSSHLNDLLNSTDFEIICATLGVGVELAQRYQASVKRIHGSTTRNLHTALLSNHYNIDLERVRQIAQPFVKTPIIRGHDSFSVSTPASKGKDRLQGGIQKNVASMLANDLCAIAKADPTDSSASTARWNGWGDVKVTYYPTTSPSQEPARQPLPERSATNAPSTPTPLRRSNTSTAPQSTFRSGRQGPSEDNTGSSSRSPAVDRGDSNPPGQRSLEVPESAVVSTSIYELVNRLPADVPKETAYEYFNRLRIAKALTGSVESRRQALKARLLAIQNLAYIHIEPTFVEKVLRQDNDEPRRFQLVYQLAELIHPGADGAAVIPLDIQSIALSLLDAISAFHSKVPDIFSALNATVNHGVLLYVIRKAVAEMKEDDAGEQWTAKDEWRDNLFSLTLHITMAMADTTARSTPEIISAGLLEIMVEILNTRSNIAERTYGTLVGFLDSLIYNVQSSFQSLINAGGLEAITNLVTHEVDLAKGLISQGKGTSSYHRTQVVDYDIPFYQQQNLKFLLKFLHHLMSNAFSYGGNTDRLLRNLVDKSDLLQSIREIVDNQKRFGSLVWTNSVTILSDFLNNDPTSFAAISEAGLIESYLEALTGRSVKPEQGDKPESTQVARNENEAGSPGAAAVSDVLESDSRSHPPSAESLDETRGPLACGILPASDPISIVPTVLNAISLNNRGMKMVVASRAFDSFFEIFESPEHVRVMKTDEALAGTIGGSFDELARHHPPLRPAIANAVLDMIARVNHLAQTRARNLQWGAKLIVRDSSGRDVIADQGLLGEPSLLVDSKGKGKAKASMTASISEDTDVEMTDVSLFSSGQPDEPNGASSPHSSVTPYIFALANFLQSYTSNTMLKQSLVNSGGIELLLDLATAPSLPYDFGDTGAARMLQSVISHLIEGAPAIGLPSLLKRIQASIDMLEPVVNANSSTSYFRPFLTDEASLEGGRSRDLVDQLANGTPIVKALLNAQSLIRILYQSFPYSNRSQTLQMHSVIAYDYYDRLVKSLGPLLRVVISEEAAISSIVPSHWTAKKEGQGQARPGAPGNSASGNNGGADPDLDDGLRDVLTSASTLRLHPTENATEHASGPSETEQSSARYQNYQTLRIVLYSLMPTTFPLLQTLGKALLLKRERDQFIRVNHVRLAEELAQTVLAQLEVPSRDRTTRGFHYYIIMLHAIHEMLVNRSVDARHDRPMSPQIVAPVLIAFKRHNGLEILNNMLRTFKDEICKEPKEGEDSNMSRLAVIGMKKTLDLYAMLVNGKIIAESIGQVNLLPRPVTNSDRRQEQQIASNLIVEIRMTILPVMRELWDSPLIERGSGIILSKLIHIMKCIALGDSELHAYKRSDKDKATPPTLLQPTPPKFNWSNIRDDILLVSEQLSCDAELAKEALYRANGIRQVAFDYVKIHAKRLAGTRNPIPARDADVDGPESPASQSDAHAADEGAMAVDSDLPESLLHDDDIINELVEEAASDRDLLNPVPAQSSSPAGPAQGTEVGKVTEASSHSEPPVAKEDLDAERARLRLNLIDRCLDVIRAHPDSTYEVSELISTIILRPPGDDASAKQEVGETLVNALMSFAMDDDLKSNGRSIAAYAHLLSLLLQDKGFFKATASSVKENVGGFLSFLRIPGSTDDLPPWIPYVLLIFEILLSDDEQPGDIRWKFPSTENEAIEPLQWPEKDPNVNDEDRASLLSLILEILPRIGKEESLAISVLRILVIMTRDRTAARQVGDKKNLQRLFVAVKQLSGIGSSRLSETRIASHIMTILRHVVEDDDVVKQVMRSEIKAYFESQRQNRPVEAASYIRHCSTIALRDPKLFVQVTNEMTKLTRWVPGDASMARHQTLMLKEVDAEGSKDDVTPAVQATEDLSIHDVKPSTEGQDKQPADASKGNSQETRRPVLENPDGVVHFLLCELLNYKEVDDKDTSQLPAAAKLESRAEVLTSGEPSDGGRRPTEGKDKKTKVPFKPDEHPIFIYRCFILHCLSELLQSYNRAKVEFINFKRNAPLFAHTPVKPRSSVLNYLLTDLLCSSHLDGTADSLAQKKKHATAEQTKNVLVALVSKTDEKPMHQPQLRYDYDDEADLLFVRKFVLDTILKSYKDATVSSEPFDIRYSRMVALAEVMFLMMGEKEKDSTVTSRNAQEALGRSQAQLRRLMYEKGFLAAVTASIADIDLAFPPVKRTIKYILRVLRLLTTTAKDLSHANIISAAPTQDNNDDEIFSATSLSDIEDDREETPDLYRNSALGMLEPGRDREDDYSEDSEDDDDEEMYDEEYDEDDIGYGSEDREEDVSERDDDEDLEDMGPIEGLSGDHGVIEVTMEDGDEDDDMEVDDDDMDDDESDDDDLDSDEMDDVEDRIEIVDDEGNPLEDDGASGWESETEEEADDDDDDGEALDLEAAVQDHLDEAHVQGEIDDADGLERFGDIMRAIEDEDFQHGADDMALNDRYIEDEDEDDDEEEDEEMDEEYDYEDDYPNDPPPRERAPSLGWDTLLVEPNAGGLFAGNHQRHRHGIRSPFPPLPFVMGTQDPLSRFSDPRGFVRGGRHDNRPLANEDGLNPLLRRGNDNNGDGSSRPAPASSLVRLGFPGSLRSLLSGDIESPMSFINELMNSLPRGPGNQPHHFHFQISGGPRGDLDLPFLPMMHSSRTDNRRDTVQEPIQAASFTPESTLARWSDEVKMIFGSQHLEKAQKLLTPIMSYLIPPAIQHEKEAREKEAERQRQLEEERKKREEEKKAREAREAEEKAAKAREEAAERERAATEAAAQAQSAARETSNVNEPEAMEGVETNAEAEAGAHGAHEEPAAPRPRAFTTIRGEQVDVTELDIDPDYLEALPEEFREEVIAQTVSTRRAEAREAPGAPGSQTEVFQEFLDALPEDLRTEIVQQERAEQRRRDREEVLRHAPSSGQGAEEMDTASILMSFPPELREQVLMDQGADLMDALPPEMAAQARRLVRPTNPAAHADRTPTGISRQTRDAANASSGDDKQPRKNVVQMLDKSGVATLLRLMFINVKGGSLEHSLKLIFKDVCENRQSRLEVISTLLQILQDGSTDLDAIERSFAQLSIKAKQQKDKEAKTQTPQSLKRTFTTIGSASSVQTNSETSPLMIVQQCLDMLGFLADHNVHVPSLFLTEHEAVSSTIKRSLSRKGKSKDVKAHKYAINSLLALLDRDLVMESSAIMDSLSQLLSRVTFPLLALDRKQKEAAEAVRKAEAEASREEPVSSGSVEPTGEPGDAVLGDGTAAAQLTDDPAAVEQAPDSSISGVADPSEPNTTTDAGPSKTSDQEQAAAKKTRQLHPPAIPVQNLTLIIRIFTARECSSKTFKETLSTIKNLSVIPGAMLVFGQELARQAQLLSEKIVVHLDELLPHIEKAASGTEIQGVALAKFSPGASDQNKLLRVLTALDHLFAQKKSDTTDAASSAEETKKQDLLATLYRNATFNALWEKLSACLSAIRQRESLLNVATILLPLIEALMVVCKDTAQLEAVSSQSQPHKEMVLSSPQPESHMAGLFFTFTEEHRRILNELVRNNPSLMKGTFSHLVKNPKVLEFDNKRNWFNRSVHNKQTANHRQYPTLQLQVRRDQVFHDSFKSLYFKSGEEMKFGKLNVRFHGEEGVDAGGVTREWFQVLARQMFDANYALFVPVSSDRTTFHPNKLSGINDEHLMFFKFIGRIIGKALYEGRLLECYFSRAVYKRILGKPVSVKDMESFDPDYYKSLSWMLNNDITDIITETFSVEDDEFGVTKVSDLCEKGRDIAVTEDNKHDYVRLVVEHKLLSSVKEQMENFLKGFHEIIPAGLISIFNEQELELLISGVPEIDVDDWKSNTEYHNYTPSSQQIQWFWRAIRSFDKEELAKLLQFVTGTSKVPLNGFKELEGMNGINRFNIHRDYGNKDRLPSSHTCFNQLDLPEYESYDALRRQLLKAITAGSDYFGFA